MSASDAAMQAGPTTVGCLNLGPRPCTGQWGEGGEGGEGDEGDEGAEGVESG